MDNVKRHFAAVMCLIGASSEVQGQSSTSDSANMNSPEPGPEGNSSPRSSAPDNRFVQEVVVTAQKREENLQNVPISVQAFSASLLDAKGVSDAQGLANVTPGLSLGATAGFQVTYLRGLGADGFLLADPSVALYVDGVYYPFSQSQVQAFGAVERVEVLKGPQGTLFGRNANGGAINIITKSPSYSRIELSIQSSVGDYNDIQNRLYLNVPLTENLAVSVSAQYSNASDYRYGTQDGLPISDANSYGVRLKIRWKPTDTIELNLAGLRLLQSGAGTLFATNGDPSPIIGAAITPQTGYGGSVDSPTYSHADNTVIYGNAILNTNWFDIKVLGSDQRVRNRSAYDFDGSPVPLVQFHSPREFADVETGELQLVSNSDSWMTDHLKWIAGAYYFRGRQGLDPVDFGVGPSLISAFNNILAPALNPLEIPPLVPGDQLQAHGILSTDSRSVYGQATYNFTTWAALTLGARYSIEKRILDSSDGEVHTNSTPPVAYTNYSGETDTTYAFKPKISVDFHPWEETLVYASYQQAEKSATFNAINFLNFTTPVPVLPEKLSAYETGVKTELFDGTLRLNAALFQYDIKNLQTQFVSLLAGGAVTFSNAPKSRVRGADFDFTVLPLPTLDRGFALTGGGAFLNTKFLDFQHAEAYNPARGRLYDSDMNLTGDQTPRAPRFSGNIELSQTSEVPGGSIELATDYYVNTGFYYLSENYGFDRESHYGLLGARASYLYDAWKLRVSVFGKNLTNKDYNYSKFITDFGTDFAVAPPITFGIRLNWDY